MSSKSTISRRGFLKKTSVAAAGIVSLPYFVSSEALGKDGAVAPSNRITLGYIGVGKQCQGLIGNFLNVPDTQSVAVCDVDTKKLNRAKDQIQNHYSRNKPSGGYKGCDTYADFRDVLARKDIDAVVIATPDHWHAIPTIRAAEAGKDIYCEKPVSLTIAEARAMVDATRRYGRVFQTGSMQRSSANFRYACELVRSGYIGELKKITVNIGGPARECDLPAMPVPAELDWEMWLGPAPYRPYNADIAPPMSFDGWANFRSYRDYAGGGMTDWGAHHFDIAQWGMGMDHSGPTEIIPPDGNEYKVLTYKYDSGIEMTREGTVNGVLFTGTEGRVEVNRGHLKTWPDGLIRQPIGPNDVHLYESKNHYVDFIDCIRTRSKPVCDVEIGARSATVCHLGNIAYLLKRPLKWDPVKEQFIGDAEANRELSRASRAPWSL